MQNVIDSGIVGYARLVRSMLENVFRYCDQPQWFALFGRKIEKEYPEIARLKTTNFIKKKISFWNKEEYWLSAFEEVTCVHKERIRNTILSKLYTSLRKFKKYEY